MLVTENMGVYQKYRRIWRTQPKRIGKLAAKKRSEAIKREDCSNIFTWNQTMATSRDHLFNLHFWGSMWGGVPNKTWANWILHPFDLSRQMNKWCQQKIENYLATWWLCETNIFRCQQRNWYFVPAYFRRVSRCSSHQSSGHQETADSPAESQQDVFLSGAETPMFNVKCHIGGWLLAITSRHEVQ